MTRITTKTHATARISLGRLIRSYQKGEVEAEVFRNLIYSLNLLLGYFKHDANLEILKRLDAIEDSLSVGDRHAR